MRQLLIALGIVLLAAGLARSDEGHGPPPSTDARFEFLKGLVGVWEGESGVAGMPPNRVEFRVTAGGHAVEEREFAGTPMEMVTLYYMEGEALKATHYCMLGNQPKLVASRRIAERGLSFACDESSVSVCGSAEAHVSGWSMRLTDDGSLAIDATIVADGKLAETPSFTLTRR